MSEHGLYSPKMDRVKKPIDQASPLRAGEAVPVSRCSATGIPEIFTLVSEASFVTTALAADHLTHLGSFPGKRLR
jgi:hypothetical protein